MVKRGEFPPGEMVSPRRRGWRLSVINALPPIKATPRVGGRKPKAIA
jgi:hypothetical protein